MSRYQVSLKRSAEKELDVFRGKLFDRITQHLLALGHNPRPVGVHKLEGQDAYRLRVGDYRIVYLIDDHANRVDVLAIRHRREVYR